MEKEMEKTATYRVVTLDGRNEWIDYEGTDLWEAGKIAREESRINLKMKQKYTVELREMVNEYDYDLIEFDKVTWHDLNENNLRFSYYNGDGTSDLQFEVKGKTVFVRNVPTPMALCEWYWDDNVLTRELANIDPDRIEVQKG